MTDDPSYVFWLLLSRAKEIAQMSPQEIASNRDALLDARDFIESALKKIREAA